MDYWSYMGVSTSTNHRRNLYAIGWLDESSRIRFLRAFSFLPQLAWWKQTVLPVLLWVGGWLSIQWCRPSLGWCSQLSLVQSGWCWTSWLRGRVLTIAQCECWFWVARQWLGLGASWKSRPQGLPWRCDLECIKGYTFLIYLLGLGVMFWRGLLLLLNYVRLLNVLSSIFNEGFVTFTAWQPIVTSRINKALLILSFLIISKKNIPSIVKQTCLVIRFSLRSRDCYWIPWIRPF